MNIKTQAHIRRLGAWFAASGKPLYLVGGCVRNALLSLALSDYDVCAALPPQAVKQLENDMFHVTERAYGLGTVVISQQQYRYEYTAFRNDNYGRGGQHRPLNIIFTEDMAEDAARRDFTVNALYAHTDGEVIDPLARGLSDLQQRMLRMVQVDTMEQDALRILRMVRFSAELGFFIHPDTYAAAKQNCANLANISKERIRDEFFKIIMADAKYGNKSGVLDGLHLLKNLGALQYILPGLLAGDGFTQSAKYHKYDVLEHSLCACAAAPPDLTVRLAALLHDIAKPAAYRQDGNLHGHPHIGAQMAKNELLALRTDNKLAQDVCELVEHHMFDLNNAARSKAVARMVAKLGKEQFLRLCALREADFEGSGRGAPANSAQKWRNLLAEMEQQGAPINKSQLAVNGDDVMQALHIPPGRQVGELLTALHEYALKKPTQNNYQSLIRYAKMLYTGE